MKREADKGPSVGVFYWISGKVYARSASLSALTDDHSGTGVLLSFSTHFSFWSDLREEDTEWATKDDSFYPRGRVLYNADHGLFLARMDSCIPMEVLPEILTAFNLSDLPPEKIHIVHGRDPITGDHHYQCFQCGPLTRRRVL